MNNYVPVKEIKNALATQNYTRVLTDLTTEPNRFIIDAAGSGDVKNALAEINFQKAL